jgi:membrane fusion protein (multidrug efflux system)
MLDASVTRVGSELRAGLVRVELEVHPDRGSSLPLEHGLPGSVAVDVERVTPAEMVKRAIGKTLSRRAVAPPQPPPSTPLAWGELEARP